MPEQPRLLIGLTGGIASGKSAVADLFAKLGVTIVDTDIVAREVTAPGMPGLRQIAAEFGAAVLAPDGRLDRDRMRARVFADAADRRRLEAILHPLIRARTLELAAAATGPYVVIAIPLLVEAGFEELVDRVLVVDCPPEVQIERLMTRDGETAESAARMLAAQASREDRLAVADDVLGNTGTLADLRAAVEALHGRYLGLAQA